MMKILIMNLLLASVLMAGFFNDEQQGEKAEMLENERLCKLFTKKVEDYKKTMRDDILAKTTLASYKHRASLFCAKAKGKETNTTE
jgi:hypothetical protein